MDRYLPLGDYALIGDARTAALVSREGSIDWWCVPRFDRGALFARILDADRGGSFAISPEGDVATSATYEEGTNVLVHRATGAAGEAHLVDALAWPLPSDATGSTLVRLVEGVRGRIAFQVTFAPRPEFATAHATLSRIEGGVRASWDGGSVALLTSAELALAGSSATARFEVGEGERVPFVLTSSRDAASPPIAASRAVELLDATRAAWLAWDARTRRDLPFLDAVRRSALVLRLLVFEPTGAIVAAPTTSLPEEIGGVRNWDYRFSWVRDSAFLVHALRAVGHPSYAQDFLGWLVRTARSRGPPLRVLYAIGGEVELPEHELSHLEGYRGSRPVRVGNAAATQTQLDIHGELLATVHVGAMLGYLPDGAAPVELAGIADYVASRWREPDAGIWEARSEPRHYVVSKAMAWVALDRALALGLPGDHARWRRERDAVRSETLARGWNDALGAFQMAFDFPKLDAATLLLPLVGFVDANDARMRATVAAIERDLVRDGLVRRYEGADDGVAGGEGAFTYCTFWLIDNLVLQGRGAEATALFERVLRRASPLGLFSEEVDPATGELLGNFPQAFPHLGLLHSAVLLRDLGRARHRRVAPLPTGDGNR